MTYDEMLIAWITLAINSGVYTRTEFQDIKSQLQSQLNQTTSSIADQINASNLKATNISAENIKPTYIDFSNYIERQEVYGDRILTYYKRKPACNDSNELYDIWNSFTKKEKEFVLLKLLIRYIEDRYGVHIYTKELIEGEKKGSNNTYSLKQGDKTLYFYLNKLLHKTSFETWKEVIEFRYSNYDIYQRAKFDYVTETILKHLK